jgi:hypothetical protein
MALGYSASAPMKTNIPVLKMRIPFFIAPLCTAIATWLFAGSPAQARYVVTLQEVGPNVVATGSGTIDLTGLTLLGSGLYRAEMVPSLAFIVTGPANFVMADAYFFPFNGPGGFGFPVETFANSGSGDVVGLQLPFILVPQGYISGNPLSDSSTYDNQTFSSLGLFPTSGDITDITWRWGTGPDQSFRLEIEKPTVRDSGSTLGLLLLGLTALFGANCLRLAYQS